MKTLLLLNCGYYCWPFFGIGYPISTTLVLINMLMTWITEEGRGKRGIVACGLGLNIVVGFARALLLDLVRGFMRVI